MNRLRLERREQVISCLVQGMGIGPTARVTGVAKNTVAKLLHDCGVACSGYLDYALRNLPCTVVQCDEIWSFARPKTQSLPARDGTDVRDVWTWTAIDPETGLVPSWLVGRRDERDCYSFLSDLRSRMSHRVIELTTSGLAPYLSTIEPLFSSAQSAHAALINAFERGDDYLRSRLPAYSGVEPEITTDSSDRPLESKNLNIRIGMPDIAESSNIFSNKVENHAAAISLHFMYHNFARAQFAASDTARTRVTPAMATEVAAHVWSVSEIAALLT